MNRLVANAITCGLIGLLSMSAMAQDPNGNQWIGTWATAPQPPAPGSLQSFRNQTLRLIVHATAGGAKVRIKISNTFGDHPLLIGAAHLARRKDAAEIDPVSDRSLTFHGQSSTRVEAGSMVVSDPVTLDVPALSDLAISLFLPATTEVRTAHLLAMQTSYISAESGDSTAKVKFLVAQKISTWPFLTGVDVEASSRGAAVVAFGSSLTDGDGTDPDSNGRANWRSSALVAPVRQPSAIDSDMGSGKMSSSPFSNPSKMPRATDSGENFGMSRYRVMSVSTGPAITA
jgi:hypothetical protein